MSHLRRSTCMANRLQVAWLILMLCVPASAQAQLRAEVIASGFTNPLNLVFDPVVSGVFYVVEQRGLVRVVQNGQLLPAPFIDLRNAVESGGEQGLLGMAFPPDAAASGRVFFNFTDVNGDTVVARFTRSAATPL